jgi:transposase
MGNLLTTASSFVGIDISKHQFHYFIRPSGVAGSCSFAPDEIDRFIAMLSALDIGLIVMEATGGYEKKLAGLLCAAHLPVVISNPRQTHDFAKCIGRLAKSDSIDAAVLAQFAESIRPPVRPLPHAAAQALKDLVLRRDQLVQFRTAESNRLQVATTPQVHKSIRLIIKTLERSIAKLDKEIDDTIASSPLWKAKDELLQSTPSIGDNTSHKMIAILPELGTLNRGQISALVGLAPYDHDSGSFTGQRSIRGGRSDARDALYMACVSGIRFNSTIKSFYDRLRARGKPYKVAMVACMRKLLTIINYMLKTNSPWNPLFCSGLA